MMDFITIPLVVGTITLGIYKLFELFVCKKERIIMIEKLADRVNTGEINSNLSLNLNYSRSRFTFGSLKSGLLMLGIGLGLLVAYFICVNSVPGYTTSQNWKVADRASVVYGACVLLFGGAGLLTAFLIEMKIQKKEKE
ncbi:DUF6249 domain-containing protein [Bacteroides thetaiotaomicron]|uniref:DUF6249 domain-containing protein n=1 Tax=Bacteroides thetaiotaomicron TaxID=818 RepID=UPI0021651FEE|nr:DUF6249 domain-containing protein [Bacteroides thetaiotaomicron]MCS2204457.1 hypothetical protein [Bacteroides thetaiotaomicron]MCS2782465.1 hypothetical protein [Bacteroides thetaiotaomicron]MDC2092146.1 hypothetical protein [Bacteroides thetaiotaomicron]MDC2099958.1 hypothetical protein [Bacteroides thetaiotaomicron]MDC2107239.1 hypothetical protein [Bacteroides thetaiotaomicron]